MPGRLYTDILDLSWTRGMAEDRREKAQTKAHVPPAALRDCFW